MYRRKKTSSIRYCSEWRYTSVHPDSSRNRLLSGTALDPLALPVFTPGSELAKPRFRPSAHALCLAQHVWVIANMDRRVSVSTVCVNSVLVFMLTTCVTTYSALWTRRVTVQSQGSRTRESDNPSLHHKFLNARAARPARPARACYRPKLQLL